MNQYDSDYKDIDNLYRRKDIKNSKRKGENMNIEDKILNGIELTEDEVREVLWNWETVEENVINEGRWEFLVEVIICINNRYFSINYSRGKTECQENYYYNQIAEEKVPKLVTKVIYVDKPKAVILDG